MSFEAHDEGGVTRVERTDGKVVCDFCLARNPCWEYPASLVAVDAHPAIDYSDDEWAACERCSRLIERGDINGLARYMVLMQPVNEPPGAGLVYPPLVTQLAVTISNVQRFMLARTGPRRALKD